MHRPFILLFWLFALSCLFVAGCNLSGDPELEGPECEADDECVRGVCLDYECVDCIDNDDCAQGVCHDNNCVECIDEQQCTGDQLCQAFQCISGCEELECGAGACVDDDGDVYCECDEDAVLVDGVCQACDCDIENGTGDCTDGVCEIVDCDEGYSTEDDDPATGCECAPTDTPDPVNFTDGNCDGIDGDASRAVFVSQFGDDDHDGMPARPVRSINRGVELAAEDDERDHVYIGDGEFVEEEPVRLEDNISLFGGFHDAGTSLEEWERGPDYETILRVQEGVNDHRPLEIVGNTEDVEVQLLTVIAGDGNRETVPGGMGETFAGSSVGIMVYDNSFPDVHVDISHVDVETGQGMDGDDGAPGESGGTAEDGQDAPALGDDDYGPGAPHTPEELDGDGGECPDDPALECQFGEPRACPGGAGGHGGYAEIDDQGTREVLDGSAGQTVGDADGGDHGAARLDPDCDDEDQVRDGGDDGDDGTEVGDDGADATSVDSNIYLVELEMLGQPRVVYQGTSGARGEPGGPGDSGAGGGGGGGVFVPYPDFGCGFRLGGGGGAGGLGGCGGQGGEGGHWGGASIGILIHSSEVTVTGGSITTDDGGAGGDGADGGSGGTGGSGGDGADSQAISDPETAAWEGYSGGSGGDGADGGQGGGGSGGEGGASFGIAYGDVIGEGVTIGEDVEFDVERGGIGGRGAGDAEDGPHGKDADVYEF